MQGALVILGVLTAVGLLLFYADRRKPRHGDTGEPDAGEVKEAGAGTHPEQVCCGLHALCEKKYSRPADAAIEYYDDEELDALRGRDPAEYSEAEREQLRDVVLTLRSEDAWGWARSLEQRDIRLPDDIRDELLILLQQN